MKYKRRCRSRIIGDRNNYSGIVDRNSSGRVYKLVKGNRSEWIALGCNRVRFQRPTRSARKNCQHDVTNA